MTDHTTVTVDEIPPCAFPHAVYTPAAYDGKTTRGPWAYMCQQHHILHGVGLGLGKGQRLVLKGASVITPITHPEVPPRVYIDLPQTDDEPQHLVRHYPSLTYAMTGRDQQGGPEFRVEGDLPDVIRYLEAELPVDRDVLLQILGTLRLAGQ